MAFNSPGRTSTGAASALSVVGTPQGDTPCRVLIVDGEIQRATGLRRRLGARALCQITMSSEGALFELPREQYHALVIDPSLPRSREVTDAAVRAGIRVITPSTAATEREVADSLWRSLGRKSRTSPEAQCSQQAPLGAETLRQLGDLWERHAKGLLLPSDGGPPLPFSDGGPVGGAAQALGELRGVDSFVFRPGPSPLKAERGAYTHLLWNEALRHAREDLVLRNQRMAVRLLRPADRLQELPLGGPTRALLGSANGRKPLKHHVKEVGGSRRSVGRDLSALQVLGFVELVSARRSSSRSRSTAPAPFKGQPVAPSPKQQDDESLERMLRAEVQRLQSADAWTVLCLPRTEQLGEIIEATNRQTERYSSLANDTGRSWEVRRLATAMLVFIDGAFQEAGVQAGSRRRKPASTEK